MKPKPIYWLAALLAAVVWVYLFAHTRTCHGAPPPGVVCKDGICKLPPKVTKTIAELGAAVDAAQAAFDATVAAVEAAKTTLAKTVTDQTTKQAALDAAKKALLDALNPQPVPPPPDPKPPTPPIPTPSAVSLVMVTSSNCPACTASAAAIEAVKAAGYTVQTVNGDDPAVAAKWRARAFPTWVVLVNGSECNPRQWTHGTMLGDSLKKWLDAIKATIQ